MVEIDDAGIGAEALDDEAGGGGPESAAVEEIPAAKQADDEAGAIGGAAAGGVDDGDGKGGDAQFFDGPAGGEPGDAAAVGAHLEDGVADAAVEKKADDVTAVVEAADH